ncbi:hypothetical protein [Marinoscillum furvescens]|uniref:Uncharacterized protein n=1 Tax=Marinoscillum furvescens DSM 4134 TaxID=1122208 RepID=A0A3D9L6K5_MARFU|nr:hypothetical protein [Marinoscillum furvescens]REE01788.1 hypothetical protein C7460_103306 [Marinoscillum furvescens DSM 4134]
MLLPAITDALVAEGLEITSALITEKSGEFVVGASVDGSIQLILLNYDNPDLRPAEAWAQLDKVQMTRSGVEAMLGKVYLEAAVSCLGDAIYSNGKMRTYQEVVSTQGAIDCALGAITAFGADATAKKLGTRAKAVMIKVRDSPERFVKLLTDLNFTDDQILRLGARFGVSSKSVRFYIFKLRTRLKLAELQNSDALLKDLEAGDEALVKAFQENVELVDAWKAVRDLPESVRTNTSNLENLNKALKQDGYGVDYFEDLLKSKENPQNFIDDYVSKIGDNGKFVDNTLETDYTSYIARKAKEDKPPRDRADWNHTRDYMLNDSPLARGNNFNRKAWENEWYPAWEVRLDNGKFIDGYNPFTKEIVSRKATDLIDVSESTFRGYLDELVRKYAPPKKITTKKQGAIYDQLRANPDLPLDSKLILEIPESNKSFYDIERYTQIASEKGVLIKFAPE